MFVAGWLIVTAAVTAIAGESPASATLRWKNGDELPGTLVGAAAQAVRWQSPVLSQPIGVNWDYLDSVRATMPAEPLAPGGTLRFSLANGDVIDGELVGISDDKFGVRSRRHGDVAVLRAMVRGISRADHAEFVDLTRASTERWQSLDRQWNPLPGELAGWKKDEPGQVSTTTAACVCICRRHCRPFARSSFR